MNKTQLSNICRLLEKWRDERYLTPEEQQAGLARNLAEELGEYANALKIGDIEGQIDALCDIMVFAITSLDKEKLSNLPYTNLYTLTSYSLDLLMGAIGERLSPDDRNSNYNINHKTIRIIHRCSDMIANLGYKPYECMLETIMEISSRTGKYDPIIKKWVKDTSPEAQAKWYKADYTQWKGNLQNG